MANQRYYTAKKSNGVEVKLPRQYQRPIEDKHLSDHKRDTLIDTCHELAQKDPDWTHPDRIEFRNGGTYLDKVLKNHNSQRYSNNGKSTSGRAGTND